ncbi:uncharacterized protein LOC128230989 [Mya arenaria]|uniref:uncharacterized protein LOC128230989 n=1 Tax=Mya arenaria TaxID=6604 RepID=UPI0022DEE61D|nr:uncharacterized protein LOC128230989 [Mya arenaria]
METEFKKETSGKWFAPLPFRKDRPRLPNNRVAAERRAKTLDYNLRKDENKRKMFTNFMEKVFENGHAELAPTLLPDQECWYLPVFGVTHPQKPGQIRCVFDSSAKHCGISLNDVLLTGPDFTNSLLGVLLRFRKEPVAITADIQQMFYCFNVREDHRDYLRFLRYEDNDPKKALTEYRMCVQVFGNSPSPAIATYGLRKSVEYSDSDVVSFVTNNFYVDDALTSLTNPANAVSLLKLTQNDLQAHGLYLHKIASNCDEVMLAFPLDELAKGLLGIDIKNETLPVQRSLDASEQAIAAVAYLLTFESDTPQIGFLLGKSKVAPIAGHTIPRLELSAAVMAVEIAQTVAEHLGISIETFTFHTDSMVVLGYINNNTRRFHTYVSNRVEQIRRSTKPAQWRYVCTKLNPSDCATRGLAASDLMNSAWLQGPTHLTSENSVDSETYHLVEPEHDKELRVDVNVSKSAIKSRLGSERFSRFSEWRRLVQAIAYLQHFVEKDQAKSQHKEVPSYQKAEKFIIKVVQAESYLKELDCLKLGKPVSKQSHILQLDPYLDEDGLLRVGGRLSRSSLSTCEKNPIIIPGDHHISVLLIRHYHESVQHQGRHFTAGAVRKAGFWITGGSGRVSSFIFKCVKCRKLRGNLQTQKMAELPSCRLSEAPPLTYVGVDTFGPWQVSTRRTKGGQASSKRWAVLFTCMIVRAIHIEVVEELSSSAFINALRRFVSIRGKVKEFYSDRAPTWAVPGSA